MRKGYIPLALVLGGVVWFATTGSATESQARFGTANMMQGERVIVWLDGVVSPVSCEVMSVHDEFLGCAAETPGAHAAAIAALPEEFRKNAMEQRRRESWYNLRFVTRIERLAKD